MHLPSRPRKRHRSTHRPSCIEELPLISSIPLPPSIRSNDLHSVHLGWVPSLPGLPTAVSWSIFSLLPIADQQNLAATHRRLWRIFKDPTAPHYIKLPAPLESFSDKRRVLDSVLAGAHISPMDLTFLDSDSFVAGQINADRISFWDTVTLAWPEKREEIMDWVTHGVRVERYLIPACGKKNFLCFYPSP